MNNDFPITSSYISPDNNAGMMDFPDELYDWDDFLTYFPIIQGNWYMSPFIWKVWAYNNDRKHKYN